MSAQPTKLIEELPEKLQTRYKELSAHIEKENLRAAQIALTEILDHYEQIGCEVPAGLETQYGRMLLLEATESHNAN